jgi:hypothetical protein
MIAAVERALDDVAARPDTYPLHASLLADVGALKVEQARTVAADATVVRAHQHAAGARREPQADVDPARLAVAALSAPAHIRGCGE